MAKRRREGINKRKERFQEAGVWEEFVEARDDLAEERGVTTKEVDKEVADNFYESIGFNDGGPDSGDSAGDTPADSGIKAKKEYYVDKPKSDMRAAVEWVFENLGLDDVQPEDAPSAGAWSMFEVYRVTNERKLEFYTQFAAKLLPTRSQLDIDDARKGDGKDIDRWIEDNLQVPSDSPEDPERKSPVPSEDDRPGEER